MAASTSAGLPTLDGVTWGDSEDANIPISAYDDENDLPPEYSPALPGHSVPASTHSYTAYDTNMLDDDYEPDQEIDNSLDYTLGSTDIVINGEVSPKFSHPLSKALADSIKAAEESNDVNVINMTNQSCDFMEDEDSINDGEYVEEYSDIESDKNALADAAALAAGSALSAVRSRSQGNSSSDANSFPEPAFEAIKAATAIVGDVSAGVPSAMALESLQRAEARTQKIPKRSKLTDIRRSFEPPASNTENGRRQDEPAVKQRSLTRQAKDASLEKRGSSVERNNAVDKSSKSAYLRAGSKKMEQEPEVDETEEEKQMRKEAAKALKNKTADMLKAIAEAKAKDVEEKRKKEEAQKKRKAILTARVMAEAGERRSMSLEDKERYRPSSSGPAAMGARESKKAREAEEAKAIAESTKGLSDKNKSEEMVARVKARQAKLEENLDQQVMSIPARDFADWKRKNSVPKDGLVFAMTGWYPCVKQALLDRGWFFNADPKSPFFDLKWTLRSLECDQDALQSWQLTNHFLKNIAITTKVGLIKSLRSLVWLADVHANDVIPRGYDLSVNSEMQAFIDDFRCQSALNILKDLYIRVTGISFPPQVIEIEGDEQETDKKESSDEDDSEEEYVDSTEYIVPVTPRMLSGDETDAKNVEEAEDEPDKVMLFKTMGPDCDAGGEGEEITETAEKRKVKKVKKQKPKGPTGAKTQINAGIFACCCAILERCLRPTDENFLDIIETQGEATANDSSAWNTGAASSNVGAGAIDQHAVVSALQWEIISKYDIYSDHTLPEQASDAIDAFIPKEKDEGGDGAVQEGGKGKGNSTTGANSIMNQQRAIKDKKRKEAIEKKERSSMTVALHDVRTIEESDVSRMNRILHAFHKKDKAQAGLNGSGSIAKNIWIVKPGAKSRGRGIATFAELPKLLKYVDAGTGSAQSAQWVVQKYMENPLCIAKHKFDLRQWVLVTDWNPLTIYFYDECYARFSVEEYTTSDEGLENAYVHLVNNSISKANERFHVPIPVPDGDNIEGFMWSQDSFGRWLKASTGRDMMKDKIQPRMKEIAQWSLMCASEAIEHRKNSWELYGFDFMVDDNYNAWLIEINSSPACDYSTKTTERYVQKALVELLSVTLDMREWEKKSSKTRGEKPDTGGWEQIYKGPFLEMPTTAFGADMTLKGDALKPPKKKAVPNVRVGYDPNAGRGVITDGRGQVIETGDSGRGLPKPPQTEVERPQVSPFPNRSTRTIQSNRMSSTAPTISTHNSVDSDNERGRISSDAEPLNKKYGSSRQNSNSNSNSSGAGSNSSRNSNKGSLELNRSLDGSLMNDSLGSLDDSMEGPFEGSMNDSDDDTVRSATQNAPHIGRGFPRGRSLSPARGFVSSTIPTAPQVGSTITKTTSATTAAQGSILYKADIGLNEKFTYNNAPYGNGSANNATLTDAEILASERKENVDARQRVREVREQRAKDIVAARRVPVPPVGRDNMAVKAKVFELPF